MLVRFNALSGRKMSNTKYHQFRQPRWWVRFEVNDQSVFAKIDGEVRGDRLLDREATVELPGPGDYRVHTGVGPRDGGIREEDILRVNEDGTTEWNPQTVRHEADKNK